MVPGGLSLALLIGSNRSSIKLTGWGRSTAGISKGHYGVVHTESQNSCSCVYLSAVFLLLLLLAKWYEVIYFCALHLVYSYNIYGLSITFLFPRLLN